MFRNKHTHPLLPSAADDSQLELWNADAEHRHADGFCAGVTPRPPRAHLGHAPRRCCSTCLKNEGPPGMLCAPDHLHGLHGVLLLPIARREAKANNFDADEPQFLHAALCGWAVENWPLRALSNDARVAGVHSSDIGKVALQQRKRITKLRAAVLGVDVGAPEAPQTLVEKLLASMVRTPRPAPLRRGPVCIEPVPCRPAVRVARTSTAAPR